MKPITVIGLLGPTLDTGFGPSRWERWRPTVAVCQHEDLLVERFDILYQKKFESLLERVAKDIRSVSPETETVAHPVEFSDPWDFEEVYGELHDFARTYPFDPESSQYLVHITTGSHVAQICLYLLTEARYIPGKLLQTSPRQEDARVQTPEGEYRVIDLDLSKYDRIAMRFEKETRADISFLKCGIETRNPAFNELIERIERVASNSRDPILLTGPTGAGKSNLARRIHELKKARRQLGGDFVEVNCATVRGDAAMSALFGHKRGAFTGAASDRMGLLRAADGGMLFLDEVGELGLDEQSMLLRAVEEKRFLPVGSDRESESDFQLICGTNRDLAREVADGRFREDLLARINLWTFELPGLARRPEDIEPNLEYELDRFAGRNGRQVAFNKEARRRFLGFATSGDALWAANFRDLSGAVTRMSTLAPGGRITEDLVDEEIGRLNAMWGRSGADGIEGDLVERILGRSKAMEFDRFDRVQLEDVLKVCMESKSLSSAGRKLFEVSRTRKKTTNDADRLKKYLSRFGLEWKDLFRS